MFLHLKTRVDLCLCATRSRLTESTRDSVRVLTFSCCCCCLLFGDEGSIFFLFDDSFEGPFGLLGARQPTTTTTEA